MSVADAELRRALSQALAGSATVWTPDVTTSQRQHADRMETILERGRAGGKVFNANMFAVWYRASKDLLPDSSAPSWTEELDGSATTEISSDLLDIEVTGDGDSLFYFIDLPTLDAGVGTTIEVNVNVSTSDTGMDHGSALSVSDGTWQSAVWLRSDGFNISGLPHVYANLSDRLHRIRVTCRDGGCSVYVDGLLRQQGLAVGETSDRRVTFGSWVPIVSE